MDIEDPAEAAPSVIIEMSPFVRTSNETAPVKMHAPLPSDEQAVANGTEPANDIEATEVSESAHTSIPLVVNGNEHKMESPVETIGTVVSMEETRATEQQHEETQPSDEVEEGEIDDVEILESPTTTPLKKSSSDSIWSAPYTHQVEPANDFDDLLRQYTNRKVSIFSFHCFISILTSKKMQQKPQTENPSPRRVNNRRRNRNKNSELHSSRDKDRERDRDRDRGRNIRRSQDYGDLDQEVGSWGYLDTMLLTTPI